MYSLFATLCLALEIVLCKYLGIRRGVDGRYLGFNILLSEGVLGTACLIVAALSSDGMSAVDGQTWWMMMVGGVTGVIAINLLQYSVAIGVAGIASAVFNTDIVFLSSLAYFILNEPLSIMQVVGIIVTTFGAVTLSFNEELLEKCGCRKKKTVSID